VIDADGIALLPGLIDGQTYPLSNRSGVEEFIKHVIPAGVTTVVAETMEYAAIVGKDGIEYVAKGLAVDTLINPTMLHLTITHQGYVDIKNRRKVSLEI
jgi:adenine deaminase